MEPVSISRVVFITEEGRGGIEFKPAGGASAMTSDSQIEIPERKVSVAKLGVMQPNTNTATAVLHSNSL